MTYKTNKKKKTTTTTTTTINNNQQTTTRTYARVLFNQASWFPGSGTSSHSQKLSGSHHWVFNETIFNPGRAWATDVRQEGSPKEILWESSQSYVFFFSSSSLNCYHSIPRIETCLKTLLVSIWTTDPSCCSSTTNPVVVVVIVGCCYCLVVIKWRNMCLCISQLSIKKLIKCGIRINQWTLGGNSNWSTGKVSWFPNVGHTWVVGNAFPI